MKIIMDLAAIRAAAEREDAGPNAVVSRRWLRDVALLVAGAAEIELVVPDQAPTPMVAA